MDWEGLSYHFVKSAFIPDLEEIDNSKVMSGSVQEIILRAEAQEPVEPSTRRSPPGWDADF